MSKWSASPVWAVEMWKTDAVVMAAGHWRFRRDRIGVVTVTAPTRRQAEKAAHATLCKSHTTRVVVTHRVTP